MYICECLLNKKTLALNDSVPQNAQTFNFRLNNITRFQILRWITMHSHTRWCSRQYNITRFKCNRLRKALDDIIDSVDQLRGVTTLLLYPINATLDGQFVWIGNQTFMNDRRTKGTKSVHRFSDQKLTAVAFLLPITSGYVLSDCVPENVIQCILFGDLFRLLSNDYSKFRFPIDFLARKTRVKSTKQRVTSDFGLTFEIS